MSMNTNNQGISRRTVLHGFGAAIALPWLEGMPLTAHAAATNNIAPAVTGNEPPRRAAFLYVPNGVSMEHWRPAKTGADFEYTPIAPLAPLGVLLAGQTQRP